jgi:predicted ribonuclease YlaK
MVIFDTNVLLLNYKNLLNIDDDIVIPITVIKELDKHKINMNEAGYHARNSIKVIDEAIDKINFLLKHDTIREKMAKDARKHVINNHTYKDRAEEMLRFLGKI